jgi:hypothetical protein
MDILGWLGREWQESVELTGEAGEWRFVSDDKTGGESVYLAINLIITMMESGDDVRSMEADVERTMGERPRLAGR